MGKKLAIVGHPTRSEEVIELLKMMGGIAARTKGFRESYCYYISEDTPTKYISWDYIGPEEIDKYEIFTLEEFLEKYPFKVGDKVIYTKFGDNCDDYPVTIESMKWTGTAIEYTFNDCVTCLAKDLKMWNGDNYRETFETKVLGYKVDDVIFTNDTGWIRITNKLWDCYAEEHVYEGIGILNGHEYKDIRHHNVTGKMELGRPEFCKAVDDVRYVNSITDDIMINQITNKVSVIKLKPDVCDNKIELQLGNYEIAVCDGKTYAVRKKPVYPKTFEECCKVLFGNESYSEFTFIPAKVCNSYYKGDFITELPFEIIPYEREIRMLYKLLVRRDAYWKIAGEAMGLNRPWEPNWMDEKTKYTIKTYQNHIIKDTVIRTNCILVFPTPEMRDAFYENFKDLIEVCKELL